MTMFLDVANEGQLSEAPFRGTKVQVQGLSARQIAALLVNHEIVARFFDDGGQAASINLPTLIKLAPEAVAHCIAYGTGYDETKHKENWDKAVTKASELGAGEQFDLVKSILDTTFGERLNPFVNKLVARAEARMAGSTTAAERPEQPANVEPGHNAKDLRHSTKSLKELRDSLRSATTPEMFGATRRDNSQASAA